MYSLIVSYEIMYSYSIRQGFMREYIVVCLRKRQKILVNNNFNGYKYNKAKQRNPTSGTIRMNYIGTQIQAPPENWDNRDKLTITTIIKTL